MKERKVIGSWGVCNTCALVVYAIEHGIDDKILTKFEGAGNSRAAWSKIRYTAAGRAYIVKGGARYFLDECIRANF